MVHMVDVKIRRLNLTSLEGEYAICQLVPQAGIPEWASKGGVFSITRTPDELSIICRREQIPEDVPCRPGWRALKIEGPFEFEEIGVLASLTAPLAAAQISLLTISTFDTDYIFIQTENFDLALQVLQAAGHQIE
jgi:hypothetical protein